jgi:hypothetical protein
VRNDWTQSTDVAAQHPEKLRELTDLMFGEFAKYQVLPLNASFVTRFASPRPSLSAGRKVFTYSGTPMTGIPDGSGPNLLNTSYTITADIDVPQGGTEGAILSDGGRFGGYSLYLLQGKPVFAWNFFGLKMIKWQGPEALAPGKHEIVYDFKYDGIGFATLAFNSTSGLGRSGTGTLMIDGKTVSTQTMEHTIPLGISLEAMIDIGSKTNTPVVPQDYQIPFTFTGKINKLTISVAPPVLTEADKQKLEAGYRAQQDAN